MLDYFFHSVASENTGFMFDISIHNMHAHTNFMIGPLLFLKCVCALNSNRWNGCYVVISAIGETFA